jgi:WD40 repeat protein
MLLASGGADRVVRLWDVRTGTPLDILQGHSGRIWSIAFSPDGMILASGSHDGSIRLWDVHMGTLLHTLRSERPYERMNITHVRGLTSVQIAALKALGAVEDE